MMMTILEMNIGVGNGQRILADLFSLEKKIQGALSEISVPVLGIFAKEDKTTGYAGLEVLPKRTC